MSLQRFQYTQPTKFQGTEDLAPAELSNYALELNRRLIENFETLVANLKSQVIADSSVVPEASETPTETVSTSVDVEESKIFNLVMEA